MLAQNLATQLRLFDSLPRRIQLAIVGYANATQLSPATVIKYALTHFLDFKSQATDAAVSCAEDDSLLSELPPALQIATGQYATENEMPPDFVVELAIAHFLDPDSMTFDDCQISVQRDQVERLKQHFANPSA